MIREAFAAPRRRTTDQKGMIRGRIARARPRVAQQARMGATVRDHGMKGTGR